MTTIEWTEVTWNPTTGCDRVSPGCDHCYALTMAKRLKAMGSEKYQRDGDPNTSGPGFGVSVHEDVLGQPFSWRKPRKVFVNSMSDLFHKDISDKFIARVFATMAMTPHHTYQVLTKRHARMRSLMNDRDFQETAMFEAAKIAADARLWRVVEELPIDWWPLQNVWLGVSVEDQHWADIRIPALLDTPAAVRFLSCEPLLGPVDLSPWIPGRSDPAACNCRSWNVLGVTVHVGGCPALIYRALDWVITGGESGPEARRLDLNWVRSIRDQCTAADVAFFHKQHGGIRPKATGRTLDGRTWDEFPAAAS